MIYFTYLGIITVLHLIVEHVEIGLGHWLFLAIGDRCDMGIVRLFVVPQGEEISGLHQRCHELRVAQRLYARVFCVDRMLYRPLPIGVLVHHLWKKRDRFRMYQLHCHRNVENDGLQF